MMPEILAALEEAETPVSVLTKSPLVMRDVEIFERMVAKGLPVSVNLSVPTLDEKAWRATEPHTPSPSARLDAVAELRRRGIDSGVLIAPLMPGINDTPEQVQPIVDRAREAGATFLGGVALHLRGEVRDVFFGWLEAKRPDLLPRYEKLYASGRAYMRPTDRIRVARVVRGWGRGRGSRRKQGSSRPRRQIQARPLAATSSTPAPDVELRADSGATVPRRADSPFSDQLAANSAERAPLPLTQPSSRCSEQALLAGLCRPGTAGTAPRAGSAPPPRGRSPLRSPAPAAARPTRGRGRRSSGSARRCRSRRSPGGASIFGIARFASALKPEMWPTGRSSSPS